MLSMRNSSIKSTFVDSENELLHCSCCKWHIGFAVAVKSRCPWVSHSSCISVYLLYIVEPVLIFNILNISRWTQCSQYILQKNTECKCRHNCSVPIILLMPRQNYQKDTFTPDRYISKISDIDGPSKDYLINYLRILFYTADILIGRSQHCTMQTN